MSTATPTVVPHRTQAEELVLILRLSPLPEEFAHARTNVADGHVRLSVSGEIDLACAAELDRALSAAQADARTVTLDLRGLQFMDCVGLRVLVDAADRASASGDQFRVVRGPQVIDRLFQLTGLEHRLEMTSELAP